VSTDTRALVATESSTLELVSGGLVALSLLLVASGLVGLFGLVPLTATVGGLPFATLQGGGLALLGLGVLGVGGASRAGLVESRPSRSAGLLAGGAFALVGLVVGGLVGAFPLGLSGLWPVAALAVGAAAGAVTVLPREDIGSTVVPGLTAAAVGLVVATGIVGPGWSWPIGDLSATLHGDVAVPLVTGVAGLLGAWTAAKAYGGFGSRGRQLSAYLLVGANATWMVALLVGLVAFVTIRGFAPMTRGIRYGLFVQPWTWFYFPPIEEYVIIDAPVVWFYWPFAMEGVALTNEIDGVLPAIVGTFWLVVGAVTFAVPLGVGAAVFLTEYAEQGRFTGLVEVSTNGLWSTPSIVYGLFGLAFLVPRLGNTTSLLAGQLVLGFMLLPLVVITSRETLKSVPDSYRDASAALGVSKWETIKSVVLPAALPGVITGVILGVGRIAGETAPILLVMVADPFPGQAARVVRGSFRFTGSFPFVATPTVDLVQSSSALPYQLYAIISAGVGQRPEFAWATALVLLLVVLSFYAVGIASRVYFRRKLNQ
jgi:phosphate transport system permease protein